MTFDYFLPFPIFEREGAVVELPLEDVDWEGPVVVVGGEVRVRGGGVTGGQAGVEVDTLHVEIAPSAVHQSSTRVADLQHRPWQIQRGEISSPSYQLVCIRLTFHIYKRCKGPRQTKLYLKTKLN